MRHSILTLMILLGGLAFADPGASAEFEASALGEVRYQGKFRYKPGATVMDLWLSSGGATLKADLEGAVLVRNGREVHLDLSPAGREALSKMKLVQGDILVITAGRRLFVTGEVVEPGIYAVSYSSKEPIDDALRMAGGTRPTAAVNRMQLARPSMRKPVRIDLSTRDPAGHVKMPLAIEDGDTIVVPPRRCMIVGGVDKQGLVILTGEETLLDIVSQSGTSRGRLCQVTIIRAVDVDSGDYDKKEVYNLESVCDDPSSLPSVKICDGDLIYVPPVDGSGNEPTNPFHYRIFTPGVVHPRF